MRILHGQHKNVPCHEKITDRSVNLANQFSQEYILIRTISTNVSSKTARDRRERHVFVYVESSS